MYDQMETIDQVIKKVKFSKETKLNEITNVAEKVFITKYFDFNFYSVIKDLKMNLKKN